jgi:hypothetical protein
VFCYNIPLIRSFLKATVELSESPVYSLLKTNLSEGRDARNPPVH